MYDYYLTREESKKLLPTQNKIVNSLISNNPKMVDLIPVNNQKSFHGRAKLIYSGNDIYLMSYTTLIAVYNIINDTITPLWIDYSATTIKHINSFLCLYDFPTVNKKQWLSLEYGKPYTIMDFKNII